MKRKKKTPRNILAEELWDLCKTYIRMRDKNTCQMCGKYAEGTSLHTSHVVPRSQGNALKFDPLNLKALCFHCHINVWHKDIIKSGDWFKKKFPERWEYLQANRNKIVKLGIPEIQKLTDEYQDKIIGLEIAKGGE